MKVSYNWLKELTDLDWSAEEMAERLTLCGTACEHIEPTARHLDKVIVGEVVALKAVPGADKIKLATVDIGSERYDSVCGAPNVALGQKVALALPGAVLAGDFVIKKSKIRGVESSGMICSEKELGIADDHSGIMVLDDGAELGQPLADHLDFDDFILTFELTPNRGDSMSAIGIARDLAALARVRLIRPQFDLTESDRLASDCIKVTIDNPEGCPRYAARVITGVKVGPSPWWIRKKLITAGIRPISNVVDISNLVMIECGHPLHAFDLDRFGSDEVVVRMARQGERFATLDGNEHTLSSEVLLITNGKVGVAAGGIMGGRDSEVEDSTTNILLEAACFDPVVIRKGRRELGFVTESSQRFEKGVDPNGISAAIDRAAFLFGEVCGGEVLNGIVDCYPRRIEPVSVSFRLSRCNDLLGSKLEKDRVVQIFEDLEFEVVDGDPMMVKVPTFRPDIEREVDLIEEVVRIEGFDSIPDATDNVGSLFTPIKADDIFRDDLRRVLTGCGFDELVGHGLVDSRQADVVTPGANYLRIKNPISEELNVMRNSLAPTALSVLAHNISHRNLDLRFFEIGTVYFPADGDQCGSEEERILMTVTGQSESGWRQKSRPLDFYDLTGALEAMSHHFKFPSFSFKTEPCPFLDESVSFRLLIGDQPVGLIGRVRDKVAARFEVKQATWLAELSLAALMNLSGTETAFEPLPVYPSAPRDLAIVVDSNVRAGDLVSSVNRAAGRLAESVELFDLYLGRQVGQGRKSIAIRVTYRSSEGSLSGQEVDETQRLVINMLKKEFNAEIRDN